MKDPRVSLFEEANDEMRKDYEALANKGEDARGRLCYYFEMNLDTFKALRAMPPITWTHSQKPKANPSNVLSFSVTALMTDYKDRQTDKLPDKVIHKVLGSLQYESDNHSSPVYLACVDNFTLSKGKVIMRKRILPEIN